MLISQIIEFTLYINLKPMKREPKPFDRPMNQNSFLTESYNSKLSNPISNEQVKRSQGRITDLQKEY